MFPGANPSFSSPSAQQNANNMNLAAALYLHPSLGLQNQAYSQFYQQAQQQQLQRQFEQLVVAQAAQNAQIAFQQQQQQAYQNQQAQSQNQQKVQAAQQQAQLQQSQAQAVQMQRLNALRQQSQQITQSHPIRQAAAVVPKSRHETHAESDARRRRSLIADFMIAPSPTQFLDERGRSDSVSGGVFSETKRSESISNEFGMFADETTEKKKNSITDRLEAVEKEKKFVENQLTIVQRQKEKHESELSKVLSDNVDTDKENDDANEDVGLMSLVERIYAENRKKAARAEAQLPSVHAPTAGTVPQFQNPWDSSLVQQTIERHKIVKPYLVKRLTERRQSDLLAQKYQTEKYNMMYAEWLKKDERYCKSQKKVLRDEKHREIFEKTFPELKKAREERERCGRTLQMTAEQLDEDEDYRRRRAAAALPPMMMSAEMRSGPFYVDLNGVIDDALADHNKHIEHFLETWTDDEKQTFKEQIMVYGKNFAAIAEFLDRKSVKDCVLYYYLTKKRQNYKAFMGKKRKKTPKCYKPPLMPRVEEVAQKAPQDANDITIVGSREFECCMCKMKVSSGSNTGRILTRPTLDASGYDASSANEIDIRVCQKCKAKGMKPKVVTRCQIGTCHNPRRKVKPTRPMPAKWKLITNEQKQFLMHQMLIPDDTLKCCPACHKKISKQLDMLLGGELDEQMNLWQRSSMILWNTEDVEALRTVVSSTGLDDWPIVAEKLGRKYTAEQCREQFEKIRAMEGDKKDAESEEDDVSDEDREIPQLHTAVEKFKSENAEAEPDPSGESSTTLSADEAAVQEDCIILSPVVAKSPSTHLYKPRFRVTSRPASEVVTPPVDNVPTHFVHVKKEAEAVSPLTYRKSDASVSSVSEHSIGDDALKTNNSLMTTQPSTCVGSALFATLTSSTPDSTSARSSTQLETDILPQCSISLSKPSTPAVAQTIPSSLGNVVRGSITQGTPMVRPPSASNYESLLEKVKQMQMISAGQSVATSLGVIAGGSTVATSSASSGIVSSTLQPNAAAAVAAALPFLQGSQTALGAATAAAATFPGGATADPNMSSIAAAASFYNQFAALDPAVQYAMTMKLMQQAQQQQEYERRLAMLRASNYVDQYRQQALALGLTEQQQQAQSSQQHQLNALASDPAKLLLWQQLMQQSAVSSIKSQQQQQASSQTSNLQRSAAANTLLAAASANARQVAAAAAAAATGQLSAQTSIEQQQQQQLKSVAAATATLPSKQVIGGSSEQRPGQPISTATSQLYSDFRNAEQMRKERDENARQLEAQQKRLDVRYIEEQRRRAVEEEARIIEELNRLSQVEYPRALLSQDCETARVHLQTIERLKESRTAIQHYLRVFDEMKISGGNTAGSASPSISGVIVRSVVDERTSSSAGPVSKGAVKEFPPSVTRAVLTPSPAPSLSGQSLIGIKRTLNDSALTTAVDRRAAGQNIHAEAGAAPEAALASRLTRLRPDVQTQRKGVDSSMFDSGQLSHSMLRTHCHNVIDEEFNRGEHRNVQSGSEMKRKSGIHTVYLPSLPDAHHPPSIKPPSTSQKRAGSPSISAAASRFGTTTSSNPSPVTPHSQTLSRASPAQQQQFPHFMSSLPQHQSRFSPSQAHAAAAVSSLGLPTNAVLGGPAGLPSPANTYSTGVRTPTAALISPRTPLSINPNMPSPRSTHTSPRTATTFRAPTPTNVPSPYQMSSLGTLSPNLVASRSIASSPTFQASPLVPGTTALGAPAAVMLPPFTSTSATSVADNSKMATTSAESEDKPAVNENQQRSESVAVANYEPLSPDTSDSAPVSQAGSSTDQATNLPLFSFLNLPDNGNGTLGTSNVRVVLSTAERSNSPPNVRSISTSNVSMQPTTTGGATLITKPPPQPTYEPLSDDDE